MANLYGTNATFRDSAVPSQKVPTGEERGRVRLAYDEFVVSAATGATDNIRFMKLPKGARVLRASVQAGDLGATGAGELGWEANGVDAADPNGFVAGALAFSAAEAEEMTFTDAGYLKKFTAETQVSILLSAALDGTAGTIKVSVEYVLD